MRIVYEPEIIGRLKKAIQDATDSGKTIARFEINPYEMNELKRWFDNSPRYKATDHFVKKSIETVYTFMGIPVVEHPFTHFV